MKKKLRVVLLAVLAAACFAVTAGAASFESCADKLKDVGLFQGTGSGYELDRAPTRAEAATMLVRLLGKEAEAKELEYTAPFTDLDGWQKPYVQYLYANGLTTGATATTFEPENACTAQMYTTFLLRALGYSDAAGGDFAYSGAVAYGRSIGLVDMANCNEGGFLRDHVAAMSLTALNTPVKADADSKLLEKLIADGAVDRAKASRLLSFFEAYDAYVEASKSMSGATKTDMGMNISASVKVSGQNFMDMQMPLAMQMDMDLETLDQSKIAMTGSVKMTLDPSLTGGEQPGTVDTPIEYYYTDGYYYMNMDGQKLKMAMSFDDALAQMGDLSDMQSTEPVCLIESIATSGSETTVTYSGAGLNGMVDSVLASMGINSALDGVSMKLDDVTSKVTVKNGKISAMDVSMKMAMTVEGETMEMDMSVSCKVNAIGDSVTVTLPDDLGTYEEVIGGVDAAA